MDEHYIEASKIGSTQSSFELDRKPAGRLDVRDREVRTVQVLVTICARSSRSDCMDRRGVVTVILLKIDIGFIDIL